MTLSSLQLDVAPARTIMLLDWRPIEAPEPNVTYLAAVRKRRSRQSETSRKRQAFISGMSPDRASNEERKARHAYLDEWQARVDEND